ncbi:hypothetical protein F4825DRAFT_473868 [Nemania diffusa]|nr:hypothetical protein F4825DRAFT_473868 [Nemania diffusa]
MAGGHLHAVFSMGLLSACFDSFDDFLINYKSFCFNMQAGPPVAGRVHVDFCIDAFNINFGSEQPRDETVSFDLILLASAAEPAKLQYSLPVIDSQKGSDAMALEAQAGKSPSMNETQNFLA